MSFINDFIETFKDKLSFTNKPSATKLDFQKIRVLRQQKNDKIITNSLINKNIDACLTLINEKELKRVYEQTGKTKEEILEECSKSELLAKVLAGRIAKKASRQGTQDEYLQLEICNSIGKDLGVRITNIGASEYRATKSGEIISKKEMKEKNITKDMCLKSFDGRIEGKMTGWIFAKVVFGNGGHQDSVFIEADTLCEWVSKHEREETFVVLIDTDLESKFISLKKKYSEVKNLLILDHYSFQEFILDNM